MKFDFNRLITGKAKDAAPLGAPAAASPIPDAPATPSLYDTSTGEQYEEFLILMKAGKRPYRKPGLSVRQEYEMWLAARSKQRPEAIPENAQA
jgi:hypothetical protein